MYLFLTDFDMSNVSMLIIKEISHRFISLVSNHIKGKNHCIMYEIWNYSKVTS